MVENHAQPEKCLGDGEYQYSTASTADQVYLARQLRMSYEEFCHNTATTSVSGGYEPKSIPVTSPDKSKGGIKIPINRIKQAGKAELDRNELIFDGECIRNLLRRHRVTIEEIFPRTCAETTGERNNQMMSLKAVIRGNRRLPRWLLMQIRSTIEAGCKTYKTARVEER